MWIRLYHSPYQRLLVVYHFIYNQITNFWLWLQAHQAQILAYMLVFLLSCCLIWCSLTLNLWASQNHSLRAFAYAILLTPTALPSVFAYLCIPSPQRRRWHPTPVLLPGKSHGWRSLVGCSPMGSLRVRHDSVTSLSLFTFMHWRRKWQPTPEFLPGESQGRGSLVGCHLWGHTESDMTEVT